MSLRVLTTVVLVFTMGLHESFAQDNSTELDSELGMLISKLESKQDSEPQAKAAIRAARQLKLALAENNPALIDNVSSSSGSISLGNYQAEIIKLAKQVSLNVTAKVKKSQQAWADQVHDYVQKVKEACIKGIPSNKLELLLAAGDEVARSAPNTPKSSYGRNGEEATKLNASTQLLQQWLVYKRLTEKGYLKQAQNKLQQLASSTLTYPILDKDFIDKKIAKAKGVLEQEEAHIIDSKDISAIQSREIQKLENNKLTGTLVGESANAMASLPYNHNVITSHNYNLYLAIQSLADCFHFIEVKDLVKGRDKFSDFIRISYSARHLQEIRKKTVFQLTPILYAEINPKPPKPDQRDSRYIYDLIKTPTSIQESTVRSDLIRYYHYLSPGTKSLRGGKEYHWKEPALKQFSLLASAATALKSKDYAFALKQLRSSLEVAPLSGPANASDLIKTEIEKLRERKPRLFESSVSVMAAEIVSLQEQIDKLKQGAQGAQSLQKKTRRFP